MGKCKQCRREAPHHKLDCSHRNLMPGSATMTKTVLGRVFTRAEYPHLWRCKLTGGTLELHSCGAVVEAILRNGLSEAACACGPTEADAILALQSTLRKMAELEVVQ